MKSTHDKATQELSGRAFVFAASVPRVTLALIISLALAFAPFEIHANNAYSSRSGTRPGVNLVKSEAYALPPLVAAGGAAALAAELGISTEALLGATMTLFAVGTGVGIETYNPGAFSALFDGAGNLVDDLRTNAETFNATYYQNVAVPPGFKQWEDLTDEEKAVHGTAGGYAADCWFTLETEIGMTTANGSEPTPEPEDPNEKKKWQKGRNILTLLGVGAAVGVGELANYLSNAAADGLYDLLFGEDKLALDVRYDTAVNGAAIRFRNMSIIPATSTFTPAYWFVGSARTNSNYINIYGNALMPVCYLDYNSSGYWRTNCYAQTRYEYYTPSANLRTVAHNNNMTVSMASAENFINPVYGGNYELRIDGNTVGTIVNGEITVDDEAVTERTNVEYPQITEVPAGLPGAVVNSPSYYNNWFNTYNTPSEGTTRTVVMPDYMMNPDAGGQERTVSYNDFIVDSPSDEVDPVPDTEPVDPTNPNPDTPTPDTPTPGDDWDFPSQLEDALNRLGTNGFGNLFPFCLIYDLQALGTVMTGGTAQVNRDGMLRVQAAEEERTPELHLPLSGFGIEGIDDITFDLTSVFDMGHMLKPFWTVLFTSALLAFTLRVFIV